MVVVFKRLVVVIFLAPDGLRTIAGTARIGDVELGSISNKYNLELMK